MNLVISRCSVMLSSSASERYTAISVDGSINSRPLSIFLRLCDIWSKERQARTGISTIIPKIYWGWTKPELIYKNIPFLAIPTFCLHAFNPHSTLLIEKVRKDPKMDPKSKTCYFWSKNEKIREWLYSDDVQFRKNGKMIGNHLWRARTYTDTSSRGY